MTTERYIENAVLSNTHELGYPGALCIRRCRAGMGFGFVDLLLLPIRGSHRVVLVEAKLATAPDAAGKVIGQLLLYYAGLLRFGTRGIRMLREFTAMNPKKARSCSSKPFKALTGGRFDRDSAWREFQKGRKIGPHQIALFVAINGEPQESLKASLQTLSESHNLQIGVISVIKKNQLEIWRPC